ncbi:bifunctional diguanylate cyclase/phosphodiesterase [Mycobacterium sp. M1]|uniref:Bifunctional diguanylate cyclase/phosphodiesterase n=1 Tax=Mycolicibacter acidiphilus TaxID=2835306 RepID=A0ABS5RGQ7_9MYCO|nr:bifunctional diguanylate cyclase/phosphodiesterase [Mycolicibacter acidiphilus]MBS9533482.1 bifunctional diguanylate cyclase/phosphodiesterase [Mycolicibacter acidiphilus]
MQKTLDFIAGITTDLMNATTITRSEICERVLADVTRRLGVDRGFLQHNNHLLQTATLIAQWPPQRDHGELNFPVSADSGLIDPVLAHCIAGVGQTAIRSDCTGSASSVAVAPILLGETTIWVLGFARSDGKDWTDEQLSIINVTAPLFGQLQRRIAAEQNLSKLADHDDLTGVYNRRALIAHLSQRLTDGNPGSVTVIYLDIERLKSINNNFGHSVGDWYIQILALRLDRDLNDLAMIARLGGSAFAIVPSRPMEIAEAEALAHRIRARLRDTVTIGTVVVSPTASIGLAVGSPGRVQSTELLQHADDAARDAKLAGGDRVVVATPAMALRGGFRNDIERHLYGGIGRDALRLRYLPEVDLTTGAVVAAEALVRWQHPTWGLLLPDSFIDVAESTSAITELGHWVLRNACADLSRWRSHGIGRSATLRVNVAPAELTSPDFAGTVADTLAEFGIDGPSVCLEITERAMVADIETTQTTLAELKEVGVTIALDDFGTGYATLSHLKSLPIDMLKIDGSFVKNLGTDPDDLAIVRAIINLANAFDLQVVAEGVEDARAAATLLRYGCHHAQGFLLSRPIDADAMEQLLSTGWVPLPCPDDCFLLDAPAALSQRS